MFTGLIEEKGQIVRVQTSPKGMKLTVEAPKVSQDIKIGDSLSVNGACLTVVTAAPPFLTFDVVSETLQKTTLGRLKAGYAVNLERPLRIGDRLGGHIVLGHVDAVGKVANIRKSDKEVIIRFESSHEITKLLVEKGSIAVDGVSLTVVEVNLNWFTVSLIPHTLDNTTLGSLSTGDMVNLETDIIGKYVYKYVGQTLKNSEHNLIEKLSAGGFLD